MATSITVPPAYPPQAHIEASMHLLQRMFPADELTSPNIIFDTSEPPAAFRDPNDKFTRSVKSIVDYVAVCFTTKCTVQEMCLNPTQVEELDVLDPRIEALKQRIKVEISKLPIIQQLRAERTATWTTVPQAITKASANLLQRMFSNDERTPLNIVFGISEPPIPSAFKDPIVMSSVGNNVDMAGVCCITEFAYELGLDSTQIEQLDVLDPRIEKLKQKVLKEISEIPIVQQLRAERAKLLADMGNMPPSEPN